MFTMTVVVVEGVAVHRSITVEIVLSEQKTQLQDTTTVLGWVTLV